MPKTTKKTTKKKKKESDHDITVRLALLAGIVFMITVVLVFALSKISRFEDGHETEQTEPPVAEEPTPVEEATEPTPEEQTEPETAITDPIREAPEGMVCDDLRFICVDASASGTLLASPFEVSGSGVAFENTINWRLLDGNGKALESGTVMADAPDVGQPGDFTIRAFLLSVPETATGTLEVLEYSAKDGSPTHVVSLPVRLPRISMKVTFYLGVAESEDPCTDVAPVTENVVKTMLPIEATTRKLLSERSGTIDQPTRPGFVTNIPEGTTLDSLVVSGGKAKVVLSPELENGGGGSCRVSAIRAQIESTLKQFSTVREVELSVSGKTPEESLQP